MQRKGRRAVSVKIEGGMGERERERKDRLEEKRERGGGVFKQIANSLSCKYDRAKGFKAFAA